MKKFLLSLCLCFLLAIPAMAADLIADGRDNPTKVGEVSVVNNGDGTYDVLFDFSGIPAGWSVVETHAESASVPSMFPQTKKGNPKVGKFEGRADAAPWTCTVKARLVAFGNPVYIAAHVELLFDHDADAGTPPLKESAWAKATEAGEVAGEFPGSNWATYFGIPIPAP